MEKNYYKKIENELIGLSAEEGLKFINNNFGDKAVFSTSFGMEDQVITHWVGKENLKIKIFTIDTGRLFQETYDVHELTRKKYKISIATYKPQASSVEHLISTKGPNSFYDSIENRKECCFIRKVEPLQRALSGASIWITGLRADQSVNRNALRAIEWDEQYKLIKYNPIID